VMLCFGLNAAHARVMADRLLSGLDRMAFTGPGKPISVRAAVGLAIFPDEATELDTLLSMAACNAVEAQGRRRGKRRLATVEEGLHGSA
jgi:predicted signal transduction protein with EAL and GGDEF domain